MKRKLLLGIIALGYTFCSIAQYRVLHVNATTTITVPASRNCGTVEYNKQQQEKNPALKESRQKTLQAISKEIQKIETAGNAKSNVVHTIPVVVHVVYNTTTQNISDAQVISQITALNKDYRKTNTDFNNSINNSFGNVGADVQIEFCLAQRDPNNQATSGITRTSTTTASFVQDDAVKFTSSGGHDAWPASKYLNIWVCNLGNNLLGYAQFPGGAANTDGVVILYSAFGTTGTATSPYNKGRTATHEIGHWLELYHIWGDDGGACPSNGGQDDLVSDTPEQKDQNGGCPTFPLTSGAGANCTGASPGAMFMNYMDYTNDACMYIFTNGQSTRMNAALNSSRASLLTSDGCMPPSGGGGSGQCDSLVNWNNSYTETFYSNFGTTTWGYVTGHNNYSDKAKAEFFGTVPSGFSITGCYIKFGLISAASTSSAFNVRIWNSDGVSSAPNTVLGSKSVTYSSVIPDVNANNFTLAQFASPIPVNAPFYAGVEYAYAPGDTLALYSCNVTDLSAGTGTSWEKWSDNTWHNLNFPSASGGWGIDFTMRIYPLMCDSTTIVREYTQDMMSMIQVFPNPAKGEVSVNISNLKNSSVVLSDITGKLISKLDAANSNGVATFNTQNLPRGVYMVTVMNPQFKVVRKVVLE